MSVLADIRQKVISIVRDDATKLDNPHDYDRIISAAVNRYSKHRPGTAVADITGDGGNDYALPSAWVDEFSAIKSIEFPIGDVPATLLDDDAYTIYQDTSARKIRLIHDSPSASESFRVTFSIPRTETTVPANEVDAVCSLAASFCLEELANVYAQTSDATIGADSVNYRTKSQEFASRAKSLRNLYKSHLGIKADDTVMPASAATDLDVGYPGGSDRLTHPRKLREKR